MNKSIKWVCVCIMFDVGCLTWQTLSNVKLFLSNTQLSSPPSLHNLLFKLFVASDQAVFKWKETFSRLSTLSCHRQTCWVSPSAKWKCNSVKIDVIFLLFPLWWNVKHKSNVQLAAETGGEAPRHHICTLKSANIMWTWGVFASNFVRFCNVYTD